MANRIVFGNRGGGEYGLFISKPGFDVLTASDDNLLFSSNWKAFQFIQTGEIAVANNNSAIITHPNFGYHPIVLISPRLNNPFGSVENASNEFIQQYVSDTETRIYVTTNGFSYSGTCVYAIVRGRVDG